MLPTLKLLLWDVVSVIVGPLWSLSHRLTPHYHMLGHNRPAVMEMVWRPQSVDDPLEPLVSVQFLCALSDLGQLIQTSQSGHVCICLTETVTHHKLLRMSEWTMVPSIHGFGLNGTMWWEKRADSSAGPRAAAAAGSHRQPDSEPYFCSGWALMDVSSPLTDEAARPGPVTWTLWLQSGVLRRKEPTLRSWSSDSRGSQEVWRL